MQIIPVNSETRIRYIRVLFGLFVAQKVELLVGIEEIKPSFVLNWFGFSPHLTTPSCYTQGKAIVKQYARLEKMNFFASRCAVCQLNDSFAERAPM